MSPLHTFVNHFHLQGIHLKSCERNNGRPKDPETQDKPPNEKTN